MFHRFFIAIILLVPAVAEAQYRVNERRDLAWDYDLTTGVIKFETSIDSGPWLNVGLVLQWTIPILPVGGHTAKVRACNIIECGPEASLTFNILPMLPTTPGNLRLVPVAKVLSIPQATEVAHSYSYLWRQLRLTDSELQYLASRYNGTIPPTLGEMINFLELIFIEFAR